MVGKIERVKTGIYGLDPLIEGGFPYNRTILVSGACGTGKTIMAVQYIANGIVQYNEPGVFVTLDERPEMMRQDMLRFGWDLPKLEKSGKLAIVDASAARIGKESEEKYAFPRVGINVERLLWRVEHICAEHKAKRLVIDSVAGLGLHLADEDEIRKSILKINDMLRRTEVTAIITSEIPEQSLGAGPMQYSKYGAEEYVSDAVIVLHYLGIGTESNRSMFIRKMRGTRHIEDILPIEITKKGIVVRKPEEAYKV